MSEDANEKYLFNFELKESGSVLPQGPEALSEFVRLQLQALLDIVVLTHNGMAVEVDGFMWMKDAYTPAGTTSDTVNTLYEPPKM